MKNLWSMKGTVIPFVTGALSTVTKEFVQGLENLEIGGLVETIQTTTLLRSSRILRRVLGTWGDLLSLKQVRNHQQTLVGKTLKGVNNDDDKLYGDFTQQTKEPGHD